MFACMQGSEQVAQTTLKSCNQAVKVKFNFTSWSILFVARLRSDEGKFKAASSAIVNSDYWRNPRFIHLAGSKGKILERKKPSPFAEALRNREPAVTQLTLIYIFLRIFYFHWHMQCSVLDGCRVSLWNVQVHQSPVQSCSNLSLPHRQEQKECSSFMILT